MSLRGTSAPCQKHMCLREAWSTPPASLLYHRPQIPAEHHQHRQNCVSDGTGLHQQHINSGFEHNPKESWYLGMNCVSGSHTHPPPEMQEGTYRLSSPPFLPTCHHPNLTSVGSFPRHIHVVVTFLLNRFTHQENWQAQAQVQAGFSLKLIALSFGPGSQNNPD